MLYTEFNLEGAKEIWREEGEKIGERRKQNSVAVCLFGCIRYRNNSN